MNTVYQETERLQQKKTNWLPWLALLLTALLTLVANSRVLAWPVTGSLNTARQAHTATLLPDGRVLVAGGSNSGGILNSAELST